MSLECLPMQSGLWNNIKQKNTKDIPRNGEIEVLAQGRTMQDREETKFTPYLMSILSDKIESNSLILLTSLASPRLGHGEQYLCTAPSISLIRSYQKSLKHVDILHKPHDRKETEQTEHHNIAYDVTDPL